MIEEESLAKAYLEFSLEGGSSLEEVNEAYKDLVMAWHSDRYPVGKKRQKAEEKMKKINNARDLLKKHFSESHKATGYCACRGAGNSGQTQGKTSTGQTSDTSKQKTAQQNNAEEAEARKRNEERARRSAAEAADAKAKAAAAAAQKASSEQSMQSALEQTKLANDERLRWKVSIGMVIVWVALNIFGGVSMNAKSWWHDFSWKWERDHPSTPAASQTPTEPSNPGYISPYNKFPGGDQNSWKEQQDADQRLRDAQAEKQKQQDIYQCRMDIDKYRKAIGRCNSDIADCEAKIADPSISDIEKRKAADFESFKRNALQDSQAFLDAAEKRFTELTGKPASEVNLTDWHIDAPPTITPKNSNSTSPFNGTNFASPAPPPNSVPSNLFTSPSTTPTTEPWRPNYLQNPKSVAPFNPLKQPTTITPYPSSESLFKRTTPNLFNRTNGQN